MYVLLDFTPFQPSPGLAFWSLVIFVLFWWLVGKYAFTPIAKSLEKREGDIQNALDAAKRAEENMANVKAENEKLLALAREERSKMLQEAKEVKNNIIAEAKTKSKEEASKILNAARKDIENQKKAAISEVKKEVGSMAIEIAEQIIRKELKGSKEHQQLVKSLVDDVNLN